MIAISGVKEGGEGGGGENRGAPSKEGGGSPRHVFASPTR